MTLSPRIVAFIATAIFEYLLPALFLGSFLAFVWGTFQYFIHGSSDEEIKEQAKALMLYGLAVFFLMLVIWTIFTIIVPLRP